MMILLLLGALASEPAHKEQVFVNGVEAHYTYFRGWNLDITANGEVPSSHWTGPVLIPRKVDKDLVPIPGPDGYIEFDLMAERSGDMSLAVMSPISATTRMYTKDRGATYKIRVWGRKGYASRVVFGVKNGNDH